MFTLVGLQMLRPCLCWGGPACSRHHTAVLPNAIVGLLRVAQADLLICYTENQFVETEALTSN